MVPTGGVGCVAAGRWWWWWTIAVVNTAGNAINEKLQIWYSQTPLWQALRIKFEDAEVGMSHFLGEAMSVIRPKADVT